MQVVHTEAELRSALGGRESAFVPTMGALHAGHLSLVRLAAGLAPTVVVSIFVNPLQFGDGEDFERYPRDLDGDVALLAEAGVDIVFAPGVDDVYPVGVEIPRYEPEPGPGAEAFEAEARPGHFTGMLTVVARLLDLVRPKFLVLGEKDAQQLFLVRAMVAREQMPVEVIAAPTVREADGLAQSSRNRYLSEDERDQATRIPRALEAAAAMASAGVDPEAILTAARNELAPLMIDYVGLVDPASFVPLDPGAREGLLLVAVRLGNTRLIDNRRVVLV